MERAAANWQCDRENDRSLRNGRSAQRLRGLMSHAVAGILRKQLRKKAIELIERVVGDSDLTCALPFITDCDFCGQCV